MFTVSLAADPERTVELFGKEVLPAIRALSTTAGMRPSRPEGACPMPKRSRSSTTRTAAGT
jgi:hypothetical protein